MISISSRTKNILFFLTLLILSTLITNAQTSNMVKKVVVLNGNRFLSIGMNSLEINGVKINPWFKNSVVFECSSDSVMIKVMSHFLLYFPLKKEVYHFPLKDKNNYFIYKGVTLYNKVSFKPIEGNDLAKLKQKRYVKKVLAKYNLE